MNNYSMPQTVGYPQQPCNCPNKSEVNAVKIELINPQAFGGPQAPAQQPAPQFAQQPPAQPQAPIYDYPQAPIYTPAPQIGPMMAPVMPPVQPQVPPMAPPVMQAPAPSIPEQPYYAPVQIPPAPPVVPAPQASTPEPTVASAPKPPAQNYTPEPPTAKQEVPPAVVDQPAPVAPQAEAAPEQPAIDINPIVNFLKSEDMDEQFGAIQKIAEVGQTSTPEESNALINEEIFKGLSDIIQRDTSQMAGPTQEQINLREKKFSGEKLSPEQDQIAEQLSPQEAAEMNKQYATYSLAVMQKNFRNAVDVEAQKQGLEPVKLNEIPEINTVIQNVKANPNPIVRDASIGALSYIAAPEDKEPLSVIFELAKNDADPMVQEKAAQALSKLN